MDKKLERNQHDKMIAGVASGLAEYFEMDVTLVRVLFILAVVFGFSGILVYLIMWIVVPEKPFFQNFEANYKQQSASFTSEKTNNATYSAFDETIQPPLVVKKKGDSGRTIAGLFLIAIGAYFILAEFEVLPEWFSIFKLWPVILIALGLMIIFKSDKKTVRKPPFMNWDTKPEQETNTKTNEQPLS
ncbi:MAG: PspC domain-containing protein [Sphingobacteriaceae bacterium]|nr:PspC domain-containing protein [Sphingobacteriaceae bacterium]